MQHCLASRFILVGTTGHLPQKQYNLVKNGTSGQPAIKRTLKNKPRMETQIKFYNAVAVCAGLYGTENWILTEKYKNRIQAAETRFLMSTLVRARQDRTISEVTWETSQVSTTPSVNTETIGLTV
jgi:hypothetical protein